MPDREECLVIQCRKLEFTSMLSYICVLIMVIITLGTDLDKVGELCSTEV